MGLTAVIFILIILLLFCSFFINFFLVITVFERKNKARGEFKYGMVAAISFILTIIAIRYNFMFAGKFIIAALVYGAITGLSLGLLVEIRKNTKADGFVSEEKLAFSFGKSMYAGSRLLLFMAAGILSVYGILYLFVIAFEKSLPFH